MGKRPCFSVYSKPVPRINTACIVADMLHLSNRYLVFLALAVSALTLPACSPCLKYQGDGRCTPQQSGYSITLSSIDPSKEGVYSYRLAGLDSQYFEVGFRVANLNGRAERVDEYGRHDLSKTDRPSCLVKLVLENERDEVVINETRALDLWDWRRDFATIHGGGHIEKVSKDGSTSFSKTGLKSDSGWGSTFVPRIAGIYYLTIKILDPDLKNKDILLRPVFETYSGSF